MQSHVRANNTPAHTQTHTNTHAWVAPTPAPIPALCRWLPVPPPLLPPNSQMLQKASKSLGEKPVTTGQGAHSSGAQLVESLSLLSLFSVQFLDDNLPEGRGCQQPVLLQVCLI